MYQLYIISDCGKTIQVREWLFVLHDIDRRQCDPCIQMRGIHSDECDYCDRTGDNLLRQLSTLAFWLMKVNGLMEASRLCT